MLRFWEVLWSGHLSRHFHIYCAAAILERHRRTIMDRDLDFDGLLKSATLPPCIRLAVDTRAPLVVECKRMANKSIQVVAINRTAHAIDVSLLVRQASDICAATWWTLQSLP